MKDKTFEEEMEDYENSLIWSQDWREVFKDINKEMNMEKLEAIAFGEWILQKDLVEIWQEDGVRMWRSTLYDIDGRNFTTEELYEEFIKSI